MTTTLKLQDLWVSHYVRPEAQGFEDLVRARGSVKVTHAYFLNGFVDISFKPTHFEFGVEPEEFIIPDIPTGLVNIQPDDWNDADFLCHDEEIWPDVSDEHPYITAFTIKIHFWKLTEVPIIYPSETRANPDAPSREERPNRGGPNPQRRSSRPGQVRPTWNDGPPARGIIPCFPAQKTTADPILGPFPGPETTLFDCPPLVPLRNGKPYPEAALPFDVHRQTAYEAYHLLVQRFPDEQILLWTPHEVFCNWPVRYHTLRIGDEPPCVQELLNEVRENRKDSSANPDQGVSSSSSPSNAHP